MSEKQIYKFFLLFLTWFTKLPLGCSLLNIFIKLLQFKQKCKIQRKTLLWVVAEQQQ